MLAGARSLLHTRHDALSRDGRNELIAHVWRGRTAAEDAETYGGVLERTRARALASAPGSLGVLVLWRAEGDGAEFVVLSLWESQHAVEVQRGDDGSGLDVHSDEDVYLIDREQEASDYEFYVRGDLALAAALWTRP